nr:cytochrome c nitrite reductase small subunit [Porphyromonas pogonae]
MLPSLKHKIFAVTILGVIAGLSTYLVYMSKAYSYLSDKPEVCINCHIMGPYYATWQHSSHAERATCNDCHVPHNNVLNKYFFKAKDGLRHAYVFTMRSEPQALQAIPESQAVIYDNCVRCHSQLNQEFVKTGRLCKADIEKGNEMACWDCHRDVPHGGKNSLSSTPSNLVPYPKSPVPDWLKKHMEEKKSKSI